MNLIDLSGWTLEEKKTVVTNLFFSAHRDGAHGDWEETDGEYRVLADAFEDGFIATVVKPPEGGWRAKLAEGGVQKQYSAIAIAMIEARADDCRNLEQILNELEAALPEDSVLIRGTLRRVWLDLPRWPALKPSLPPRPAMPETSSSSSRTPASSPAPLAGTSSPETGPPPAAVSPDSKRAAKTRQLDAAKKTR